MLKKNIFKHSSFLLPLLAFGLWARAAAPPKPDGYVTDQARVLTTDTHQQLEALLGKFERLTTVQIAVVTVESLEGREISEYANKLFNDWGIGLKGKDNGALFLIAPNDRRMRIETGYGLEGILPDALAGRILDAAAAPTFREGDLNGGILAGTELLCWTIAEKSNMDISQISLTGAYSTSSLDPSDQDPPAPLTKKEKLFFALFLFFALIVLIKNPWLLLFLLSRGGGHGGGGFGGGGFGGFGGGGSGGGGASRGW